MATPHVVIVGAGSTGAACAHDLALRGLRVTVLERGEIGSGTTGRNHGLLHSGARYAVKDRESAIECIEENLILRRIMPGVLELNDGLFVALDESDLAYEPAFLEGCRASGIPVQEISVEEALRLEPRLNPRILAAARVPDGVFEPFRFCLSFLATAVSHGARVRTYAEVTGIERGVSGAVTGVRVRDRIAGGEELIGCDLVVNAAGPWAERVAAMAGVSVPVVPTPGVMVAVGCRLTNMVINHMNKPGDGDVIVPQRRTSIIGTTSWRVDDPDRVGIPEDHVERMLACGEALIPGFREAGVRGVFAVARPLVGRRQVAGAPEENEGGRELSRTFECFDHAQEGVEGFVTITGGKTTTSRAMAEKLGDLVASKLGIDAPCRTRDVPLISYRAFFSLAPQAVIVSAHAAIEKRV